jgi:uncharacterized protein YkwD
MSRLCAFLFALTLSIVSWGQCSRATVINDYNNVYLTSTVSDAQLGWTGNLSSCNAGTISTLAQTNTLKRVNYFRKLAGLTDVTFDPALHNRCQQGALMMAANNALSHTPPASWLCYSSDGASAAGSSNIALGAHSATAVTLYMNDNGLASVGHRRWILYSRASVFGHGSAMRSDVLQVFNTPTGPVNTKNIAFPSAGYFPAPLVPVQWSFGKHNANFSNATVQMTGPTGSPISLTKSAVENGYGDNTVVWTPSGIVTNSAYDVNYTVQIGNVIVDGSPQTYTYTVTICQPFHPPQCPAGKSWSEFDCACLTSVGKEEIGSEENYMLIKNPFSETLEINITNILSGEYLLSVTDFTGREVETLTFCTEGEKNRVIVVQTSGWKRGIYFVILKNNLGKKSISKIIRQ